MSERERLIQQIKDLYHLIEVLKKKLIEETNNENKNT